MDNLCNVTTGKVRFSYVHLYKPYAYQQGQEEKYQATVLVPKSDVDTKARIDAAIEAAKQKGTAEKWNGVCPPIVSNPVYDGDGVRPSDGMAFGPECKGHWRTGKHSVEAHQKHPQCLEQVYSQPMESGLVGSIRSQDYHGKGEGKKPSSAIRRRTT